MRILKLLVLLFPCILVNGQTYDSGTPTCGVTTADIARNWEESELHHCFDVAPIFENCTKVWIRVNLHFFLDDNCEGSIDPIGTEPIEAEQAFAIAEDMVDRANLALENNFIQWNQDTAWGIFSPKPQQCVPFRYLLDGVHIHCNTEAMNHSGTLPTFFRDHYGINLDSIYNGFIVELPGSNTGHAIGQPGNVFTTEHFSTGTFNHEMGHLLSLEHSWWNDGLEDTPPIHFRYDFNCDGDYFDYWEGVGNEYWATRQCWSLLTEPTALDYDGDGTIDYQDLCDMPAPCEAYPCCDWNYMNNNIMCYSSYTECCAAYTEEQIIRALETLSTEEYCPYVVDITSDCPPPMANIGVLPYESTTNDCAYCLYLSASMNESHHILEFFDASGSLFHSTGWQEREATKYCIVKTQKNTAVYNNGFLAGQRYTARLIVENHCGDQSIEEFEFYLPDLECKSEDEPDFPIDMRTVLPNPFSDNITIEYEVLETGILDISLVNVTDPNQSVVLSSAENTSPGVYQKNIQVHQLPSGIYALIVHFKDQFISMTMIKN